MPHSAPSKLPTTRCHGPPWQCIPFRYAGQVGAKQIGDLGIASAQSSLVFLEELATIVLVDYDVLVLNTNLGLGTCDAMTNGNEASVSTDEIERCLAALHHVAADLQGSHEDFVENSNDLQRQFGELRQSQILSFEGRIQKLTDGLRVLSQLCNAVRERECLLSNRERKLAEERELLELDKEDLQSDREEFDASIEVQRVKLEASVETDRARLVEAQLALEMERGTFERKRESLEASLEAKRLELESRTILEESTLAEEWKALNRTRATIEATLAFCPDDQYATYEHAFSKLESHILNECGSGASDPIEDYSDEKLSTGITWLMLNSEVKRKLDRLRIRTYGDLIQRSPEDLQSSGEMTAEQTEYLIRKMGYVGIALRSKEKRGKKQLSIDARVEKLLGLLGQSIGDAPPEDAVRGTTEADITTVERECDESIENAPRARSVEESGSASIGSMTTQPHPSTQEGGTTARIVRSVPWDKWLLASSLAKGRELYSEDDCELLQQAAHSVQNEFPISESTAQRAIELYRSIEGEVRRERTKALVNIIIDHPIQVSAGQQSDQAAIIETGHNDAPLIRRTNVID